MVVVAVSGALAADALAGTAWPNGARAAVSLAYDDALDSQLDIALPALRRYELKATFYLILSAPTVRARMADWRAAAQDGYELGNHTLFHQCSGSVASRTWVRPHRNLDTTSVAQMLDQVQVANTLLQAIDGKQERTFNAPCFEQLASGEPYWPAIREEFFALRPPGITPVGMSGEQLIALVKQEGAKGGVVNLVFHGIGGDHHTTSKEAHEELLRFLSEHCKEYWTDTYLNIKRYERAQADGATIVNADNKQLQYTGRIDFNNPLSPRLSWPGSSIEGNFTGCCLSIRLDDQLGQNFFNVFIDGEDTPRKVVAAAQGSKIYPIVSNLPSGPHRFLISKRTDGKDGSTSFQGIELGHDAAMLPPPVRKQRHIEFYGDSITTGVGNEAPDDGIDTKPGETNNYLSYASIAARNLQAEAHIISRGGIGVMTSWFPYTMPDYYKQLDAVGKNDSKWAFENWTPDVVVINLGQNDSWLIDRDKRMQPVPDDTFRVNAYKAFIQKIRTAYPRAFILCAIGSMDAARPGSKWPGYIRSAVDQIKDETKDQQIDFLVFEYDGFTKHPRVRHHQANAEKLTKFLQQRLGW